MPLLTGTLHADDAGVVLSELAPATTIGPLRGSGGSVNRSSAVVLYSNTTEIGSRYNAGARYTVDPLNRPPDARRVAFDDIPIPNERLGSATSVDITRITVGVRRQTLSEATDVDIYVAHLTTGPTPPDTELDSPGVLVGTVSLPVHQGPSGTTLVSVGNGTTTLASVLLNSTLQPGWGFIAVGVRFSSTEEDNGWCLVSGPEANADVLWEYDPFMTAHPNPETLFNFNSAPVAFFYVVVEGTPVPNVGVEPPSPARSLELAAPWPNPARRKAHVRFRLPGAAEVRAEVFDMAGRRVATLIGGEPFDAGEHQVSWEGRDGSGQQVTAGIYQIRVTAGEAQAVRKIVMVE
jgi:hypothetical protein